MALLTKSEISVLDADGEAFEVLVDGSAGADDDDDADGGGDCGSMFVWHAKSVNAIRTAMIHATAFFIATLLQLFFFKVNES